MEHALADYSSPAAHGNGAEQSLNHLALSATVHCLALATVVPIALAADTISITVMEVVDNAIMVAVPGAMDAGLASLTFWGSLTFALAIAFVVTFPVNRRLIRRGKGHAVVHPFH